MTDTTEIDRASTDLVVIAPTTAVTVFGTPGGVDAVLKQIKDKVALFTPDVTTEKGRAAIASMAYKVARSKTALDDLGKTQVADWKRQSAQVDVERRKIREELDALKDQVSKPLDDFKERERRRVDAHEAALRAVWAVAEVTDPDSLASIDERIGALDAMPERDWQEFEARADEARAGVARMLSNLRAAAVVREAELAEQERQKQETIARERREREEKIAAEAAERAARAEREATEAREREAARIAAEAAAQAERDRLAAVRAQEAAEARTKQAEIDRIAAEQQARVNAEALEQAKAEAEVRAQQVEEAWQAAAAKDKANLDAALAQAETDRQVAAEAAAHREIVARAEAEAAERKRVADEVSRLEAEGAARAADRSHRAAINNAAVNALVEYGMTKATATKAVTAIAQGRIPNIAVSY